MDGGAHDGLVAGFGSGLGLWIWRDGKWRRLHSDLPCTGCRYNLRGLNVGGECPECGKPVSSTMTLAIASGRCSVVEQSQWRALRDYDDASPEG